MYKLTRPDGWDFYSKTINYREAVGTIIRVTDFDPPETGPCGKGLHASSNPNDCFLGATVPCAAFKVEGIQRIAGDKTKTRYRALRVIEEIHDLNTLFGWKYSEVIAPIHPFEITPPKCINQSHIDLLKVWASVRSSVGASVWASVGDSVEASVRSNVWDSVRDSMWDSVWDNVRDSVRDSMWDSVWDSVRDDVWDSVGDSVGAYLGSLFPGVTSWEYAPKTQGYPYQSCVDLWRQGLVPSFDGKTWRLHGKQGAILYEYKLS